MLFEIDHITRYTYSSPVHLGVHLLRFTPPALAGQRPGQCALEVDPLPTRREQGVDCWGNPIEELWFQGHTERLEIRAHLEVETLEMSAWVAPGDVRLPAPYGGAIAGLGPYLERPDDSGSLRAFVDPLLVSAAGDVAAFLAGLNAAIHSFYHRGVRLEGEARAPEETLALGEGVCRDLAVLFIAACRQAGLAARFVSGYQQGDGRFRQRYLHAWAEVYLPGCGWLGYDPTRGSPAGNDHVAVAAAPDAAAVTPVEGGYSFRGPTITSTLETDICIAVR